MNIAQLKQEYGATILLVIAGITASFVLALASLFSSAPAQARPVGQVVLVSKEGIVLSQPMSLNEAAALCKVSRKQLNEEIRADGSANCPGAAVEGVQVFQYLELQGS